jgi:hypothetical protein
VSTLGEVGALESEHEGMAENGNGERRPHGDSRTIVALAENVAELRNEMVHLKRDTEVIRAKGHDIDQRMQESIASDRINAAAIAKVIESQAATNNQLSALASTVEHLAVSVTNLMISRAKGEGAWTATFRIGAALAAMFTATAVVISGGAWALSNLTVHVK